MSLKKTNQIGYRNQFFSAATSKGMYRFLFNRRMEDKSNLCIDIGDEGPILCFFFNISPLKLFWQKIVGKNI